MDIALSSPHPGLSRFLHFPVCGCQIQYQLNDSAIGLHGDNDVQ